MSGDGRKDEGAGNPYAPAATVQRDLEGPPPRSIAVKVVAVAAALLSGPPFVGGALFLVGRRVAALAWLALGIGAMLGLLLATRHGLGKLYVASLAMAVVTYVTVIWKALRARAPYPAGIGPAVLVAAVMIVASQVCVSGIRYLGTEAFSIPSGAMKPTLLAGDHVVVWRNLVPQRGDLVVFRYPKDPALNYIKRVVAIGGDTIELKANVVHLNGAALSLKRLAEPCPGDEGTRFDLPYPKAHGCTVHEERNGERTYRIMLGGLPSDFGPVQVPPGHMFVMGDNRHNSNDSRFFGPAPLNDIKGRVRLVYWSRGPAGVRWDRFGIGVD